MRLSFALLMVLSSAGVVFAQAQDDESLNLPAPGNVTNAAVTIAPSPVLSPVVSTFDVTTTTTTTTTR